MGEISNTAVTFGTQAAFIGWGAENYLKKQKFNPKNLRLYEIKHDTMGQFIKVMKVTIENIESYEEKHKIDQLYTNIFCAMPTSSDTYFTTVNFFNNNENNTFNFNLFYFYILIQNLF